MDDGFLKDEDVEFDSNYEKKTFIVDRGQSPFRIDKWLHQKIEYVSRQKIQDAIDEQRVLVNDSFTTSNYKIKPGDKIELLIYHSTPSSEIIPENIPIDILYEDAELIVINKKDNMVVHPAIGNFSGTLLNALAGYYQEQNYYNQIQTINRMGLVHRIDKNTTGLIVLAKTDFSAAHLAKQFFEHTIKRQYVAVVWGRLNQPQGTIRTNIARHQRHRKMFDNYPFEGDMGKRAITHFELIKEWNYASLISCHLETGRTHQIRVHMKYLGHTLFNDFEYGGDKILKGTVYPKYKNFIENCFKICPRPALHAKTLGFIHPLTKEPKFFEAPLPTDMEQLIEAWNRY